MSHLGNLFAVMRKQQRLRPVDIARKIGRKNLNKACRQIMDFEATGRGNSEFIAEIATLLNIDDNTIKQAFSEDRFDWLKDRLKPVRPYIVMRYMPAVYGYKEIPAEITEQADILEYARREATKKSLRCCLVLNGIIRIYLAADGTLENLVSATPCKDLIPSMRVGNKNFVLGDIVA